MKSSELNQRRQQATPRGVGVMCNYFVEKAENATLWDIEGNEVIDFAAGIAVLNTGHRHPKVVAAVADQLQAFTHTAYQIVPYESYVTLAERINDLAPIDGPAKTAFFTTGAEAVENAVKIARAYTGRPGLITFGGLLRDVELHGLEAGDLLARHAHVAAFLDEAEMGVGAGADEADGDAALAGAAGAADAVRVVGGGARQVEIHGQRVQLIGRITADAGIRCHAKTLRLLLYRLNHLDLRHGVFLRVLSL